MKLFPAIDLFDAKAVRLEKGDYNRMTVYSTDPVSVANDFARAGARNIHLVDLEGARNGETPHLSLICRIAAETGLFTEVGGGIRSMKTCEAYLSGGVDRVILGTAAVVDEKFLCEAVAEFGERIAVGVDLKDGMVSIRGWTEKTSLTGEAFCEKMLGIGIKTVICTDVSRDGMMRGSNHALYRNLAGKYPMDLIASGGVSSLEDLLALKKLGLSGAIIGKAYYTGAIRLPEALEAMK